MEEVKASLKQMMWFSMYKNQRIHRQVIIAKNKFRKALGYMINTQNPVLFLYTHNEQERKQEILFTIVSLNILPSVYFLYTCSYWLIDWFGVDTPIRLINFLILQWLWIFFSPVTEFLIFFSYIYWEKCVIFSPLFCYKINYNEWLVFLEQTDCDTFLHETGFHLLIFCLEFCFCIHVRDQPMLCYNVFIKLWYKSYSALENKLENVLLSGSICVRLLLFVSFLLLLFSHYVVSNSFATPWTVAHPAPLSMGFPRQEYWSGLPFPSPGDHPNPGTEPRSPALQADSLLLSEPPGEPCL